MERVCSIFSQILKFIPRGLFDRCVQEHNGDKHAKGMTCWSQCIALLFCHLGGAKSLREICNGLRATEGKLQHLGVQEAPSHSTLAYANQHRPWQMYRAIFLELLRFCQGEAAEQKKRFRFKHKLLTLDSTVISVCVSMFDWAKYVQTKGAVKLHLVLDNEGFLPQYAVISDGKTADVKIAKQMEFAPGTMLVFDRGYEDHQWWRELTEKGVNFVTRLKDSTAYQIKERRPDSVDTTILRDEVITLDGDVRQNGRENAMRLRRIEKEVVEKGNTTTMVFVTNHPKLAATTIASIYKDRWQIELFFKAIKQSLRIKTFIGTSENAVHTQIWTALIAMLILRFLQMKSTWKWSLSHLVALLRQQLFVYRDLWKWVNQPFEPPVQAEDPQLPLALGV